jgi:hypothetical protein
MKKNYLIARLAAGILGSIFLLSSFGIGGRGADSGVMQSFKVTRSISGKELESAFWKAGTKEIPLYIYMVKKSPDNAKEDIDLMLLSTSPDKRSIPFGRVMQEAEFRQQCAWYVGYLKANGVKMNDATLVYHLMLRKDRVKDNDSLEICVSPLRPQDNYLRLTGESGHAIATADKVENGHFLTLDSVEKCPPKCIGIPFSGTVKKVLRPGLEPNPQ